MKWSRGKRQRRKAVKNLGIECDELGSAFASSTTLIASMTPKNERWKAKQKKNKKKRSREEVRR